MPLFTWTGVRSIFRKEMIQLLRDKYLMVFIITLPIIQLMVTGLAVQKDIRHVPTVVCNYDNRNASVKLLNAFANSTFFDIQSRNYVSSEAILNKLIRQGKYRVGLIIPPDYSEKALSGMDAATVQVVVDGTNAGISKNILDAAKMIVTNVALQESNAQQLGNPALAGDRSPVSLKSKVLYNPDLKTSYFLIPAILAIILHMMTILFTSFAIVRERETGTLEQLMVTPLLVGDLMLGKVVPYAVIGLLDMCLTLGVMVWFFDIAISGSFFFLLLASLIFIVASLGVGLVISTTCQTQVQAIQLTMGLLLPSLLLTGFVFPLEPMPFFVKWVSYAMPLTHYLDIIRGVTIKGAGLPELWLPTLVLLGIGLFLLTVSVLRFKKQVA
jgi:ABC-type multidrug transport system permease subunit